MKYRKKPVVIEAIQWTGKNYKEINDWSLGEFYWSNADFGTSDASIKTLEGKFRVAQFDYVIRGIEGEFYSCKPDIFEKTYEAVE